MSLWAILSDVHGNREALEAVLADAEAQGADKIASLGDVVDYGPDPTYCVTKLSEVCEVFLVGNHEQSTVEPDEYAEPSSVLEWSQGELGSCGEWTKLQQRMRSEGAESLATCITGELHFVHASAGRPTIQYVWPGHESQYVVFNHHIDDRLEKFLGEFSGIHGFHGHTHVPAVLTSYEHREIFDPYKGCKHDPRFTFVGPKSLFFVPQDACVIRGIAGRKMSINVGSAGQPRRLGDNRASYVLTDGEDLEFRRLDYDWQKTAAKIASLPIPDDEKASLIERLETGI